MGRAALSSNASASSSPGSTATTFGGARPSRVQSSVTGIIGSSVQARTTASTADLNTNDGTVWSHAPPTVGVTTRMAGSNGRVRRQAS